MIKEGISGISLDIYWNSYRKAYQLDKWQNRDNNVKLDGVLCIKKRSTNLANENLQMANGKYHIRLGSDFGWKKY